MPYDGAEKKANLADLCARLNIVCRFDEEENIYALGDTAEYAREVPVLMYHHLGRENAIISPLQSKNLRHRWTIWRLTAGSA